MSFTHLHVHTQYSLLDGSSKIKDIIDQAKELGMDSLAITDHGVMYGVIDFIKQPRKQGLNPSLAAKFMWHRDLDLIRSQALMRVGIITWFCLLRMR